MTTSRFSARTAGRRSAQQRLSFRRALIALKGGQKIAREGWDGQSVVLVVMPGSHFRGHQLPMLGPFSHGTIPDLHCYLVIETAEGCVMPWQPLLADPFADDWEVLDDQEEMPIPASPH